MKKLEIKIEDGIEKPDYTGKNILNSETMKSLKGMKAGQSFTVKTESHKLTVQLYGRKIGKVFSSRKIYEGNTKGKNSPYQKYKLNLMLMVMLLLDMIFPLKF